MSNLKMGDDWLVMITKIFEEGGFCYFKSSDKY